MWIAQNAAERSRNEAGETAVGKVTVGGAHPAVLTDGEIRSAEILACGGCVRTPSAGDEVLLIKTADGDCIVVGAVAKQGDIPGAGELVISGAGAEIRLSGGSVSISGGLNISGAVSITGALYVNGKRIA